MTALNVITADMTTTDLATAGEPALEATAIDASTPRPKPLMKIRPSRGWSALALAETWQFRDCSLV